MTFTHANGDVDVQLFGTCGGAVLLDRAANTNNESFVYTNNSGSSSLLMRVYLGADTRNDYSLTFSVAVAPCTHAICGGRWPISAS